MYKKIGNALFKYRSYTPLPFVLLLILFANPNLISIFTGTVIVLIGEVIRVWAVSYAGSETRTTSGVGGSFLVTQGPFGILRNPLYLGNILIYSGFGVMSFALFPYLTILCFVYFVFQYYCIVINEEEYLEYTFKDKFILYKKFVNRALPSFKSLPDEIKSALPFQLNEGLKSDKRSITAIIIVLIIVLFFYFSKLRIFG